MSGNSARSGARPQTGLFTFILNRNRGRVTWRGVVRSAPVQDNNLRDGLEHNEVEHSVV